MEFCQSEKVGTLLYLPPTNEVYKGYVFTGVCLSTRGEGVLHPRGLGRHPSPQSDTTGYGQRAGGTHATGMHSCS